MIVNISDYGDDGNSKFVEYTVSGLLDSQMNYLMEKLDEETSIVDGDLIIKMYFEDRLYPFQSDVAKIRLDDFIAREEIEMGMFISSFLDDAKCCY
ncbi:MULTISPECIES: DUF5750 family protein [Methanobrevibacter]|uniref:DUF5750 family protein n=1 Tax=Methanobrevibacter TaxID=2172 RepID=UPI0015C08342|nr:MULTISPECIES: DUF5750 family protein [Methanobrevibacter]MBS7258651.1 hypothetical protein [Methanobrevibacter sp.]MCI7428751.1 hypothetical protein [Methanobrevibacter sp.]MDD6775824.1 hypothetical protein [Methanobacteriaceae archaeon]MDY3096581.1 DUF5750 family protein [Methanobrevibacter sp.]